MGCTRVLVDQWDESPGGRDDQRGYHVKLLDPRDGATTRADVERLLGPPDLTEDDGRVVAYRWQRFRYEAYASILDNDDGEEDCDPRTEAAAVMYSSLLLEFDDAGVLRRHRKFRRRVAYGGPPTLPNLLAAWREELASSRT